MKKLAALALAIAFITPAAMPQAGDKLPEAYSGVAMGTGGAVGAKSTHFDFRIEKYTTDEEVQRLYTVLKEKGRDSLRREMEKLNVGRIWPTSSVGNTIAVARKRQVGDKTVIAIFTARQMNFRELYNSGRSVDYPYGFLQVNLDKDMKGNGQFIAAAKLRFDKKKNQLELESYGHQYLKAVNVRPRG